MYGLLNYGDTLLVYTGRLHFSANHGQSWTPLTEPGLNSFDEMVTDGSSIYCRGYRDGVPTVAVSTDFAQTWSWNTLPDTLYFSSFFAVPGYLYGNCYQGLFRSADQGAHWEEMPTDPVGCLQSDGQRMIGCRSKQIVVSLDNGFTWDTLLNYTGHVISLLQQDNQLFAFMETAADGCYASSDYGQHWQHFSGMGFAQFSSFIWYNGSIFGLRSNDLYRSDDRGATWKKLDLPPSFYSAFAGMVSNGSILIGSYYSGVLRSTDQGESWFAANQGLISAAPVRMSVTDEGLFAPAAGGVFHLQPDGINWINMNYTIPLPWYAYAYSGFDQVGDYLLAAVGQGEPWVSIDGGDNWVQSFVPNIFSGGGGFHFFGKSAGKTIGIIGSEDWHAWYVSNNDGLSFQPLNTLSTQFNSDFDFMDVNQDQVYTLAYNNQLYVSADGADNWALLADNFPVDSLNFGGNYDPHLFVRGNSIWVFDGNYPAPSLAFSADLGQHWTIHHLADASFSGGSATFNDILSVGNYLIAVSRQGVFRSDDNGLNWTAWSEGLYFRNTSSIQLYDGYIWVGVEGDGIWKRPITELGLQSATGLVFLDTNGDGQQGTGEAGMPNVIVKSVGSGSYANTRADGTFTLLSSLAQEQLQVQLPAPYWIANPVSQTVAFPSAGAKFALSLNPESRDLSVALTNAAALRPGFESSYVLSWRNEVPLPAANVVVELHYPADLLEFVSAVPAPAVQSLGLLQWLPGNVVASATGVIQLLFKVPASVAIGTEVCTTANIGPSNGDLFPADNTRLRCATVVGSYDPNDKQAEPATQITPAEIAGREPVIYTVRFQNTGTFPANFIRITDTLSEFVDPATFQLLSASHPCTWTMRHAGEIAFDFPNIELPPVTTDEPGSHGFVQYSVQARQDLPLGIPVRNTAHIFFDYNSPVVTNTTETVVSLVDAVQDATDLVISIFPNPAVDFARLELPVAGLLTVTDVLGRLIRQNQVTAGLTEIDVRTWPAGTYRLRFEDGKKRMEGKVVVQR